MVFSAEIFSGGGGIEPSSRNFSKDRSTSLANLIESRKNQLANSFYFYFGLIHSIALLGLKRAILSIISHPGSIYRESTEGMALSVS